MIPESDILNALRTRQVQLPPLTTRLDETETPLKNITDRSYQFDAIVEASWDGRSWRFAAEIKGLSTPQTIQNAIAQIRTRAQLAGLNPLIVVPYLSPRNIALLESTSVSGLDLCGNGIATIPGELLIVRTGNPNRFPQSTPIRNIYRGDSSLVARTFLVLPDFAKVSDIQKTVQNLGGNTTLSTVSKVLKSLEGDLIVAREKGYIKLIQPEKLLEELSANYRAPPAKDRLIGRIALTESDLQTVLAKAAKEVGSRFILTGAASASKYAVLAREPVVTAYCTVPPVALLKAINVPFERTDRFPNIDLIATTDATVYFNPTVDSDVPYASPVQSYLELMSSDKRQRETAEQVRRYILARIRIDGQN